MHVRLQPAEPLIVVGAFNPAVLMPALKQFPAETAAFRNPKAGEAAAGTRTFNSPEVAFAELLIIHIVAIGIVHVGMDNEVKLIILCCHRFALWGCSLHFLLF